MLQNPNWIREAFAGDDSVHHSSQGDIRFILKSAGDLHLPSANITLNESDERNMVVFSTGFGDGVYPSYFGYNSDDKISSLITDFLLPTSPDTPSAQKDKAVPVKPAPANPMPAGPMPAKPAPTQPAPADPSPKPTLRPWWQFWK